MTGREDETREPSRSAKKRAAKAVEELARELADLPEPEVGKLPASPEVAAEIERARTTRAHGARRRQVKHLAGVLRRREDEAEALRAFLTGCHTRQMEETRLFHDLEELRERLCDPERFAAALREVEGLAPAADREAITRLARSVHATGDRKAYREIFRHLRKGLGG